MTRVYENPGFVFKWRNYVKRNENLCPHKILLTAGVFISTKGAAAPPPSVDEWMPGMWSMRMREYHSVIR